MEEDAGPAKGPEPSGLPGLLRPRWAAAALVVAAAAGLGAVLLQQHGGFSLSGAAARVYMFAMKVRPLHRLFLDPVAGTCSPCLEGELVGRLYHKEL